jgi:hypothetical protein
MNRLKPRYFICDQCGMRYFVDEVRWSSYEGAHCPSCNDGSFDQVNHPQNKVADVSDWEGVQYPRPDVTFVSVAVSI